MTTVADGLYQFGGVPVSGRFTVGTVYFVDSATGSNSNSGTSIDAPLASLATAISKCTANNGDVIYLFPGHAETTTAIAANVAGVQVIGIGVGGSRPTITATTAATDLINITGANTYWENVLLVGAASGCTALVDIASDDNLFVNMEFRHGAAPTNCITVASGTRNKWHGCRWLGTADGPDYGILFESATENESKDFEVLDCIMNYGLYGLDNAGISNASNGTVEGGVIANTIFSGMVLTAIDFNSSSSASVRGIIANCRATANVGISIATIYDVSSYGPVDCQATDAPAAASPNAIPAATAT